MWVARTLISFGEMSVGKFSEKEWFEDVKFLTLPSDKDLYNSNLNKFIYII